MCKYKIKSNLSEKQIESDVSGYFGWISKETPLRLLDVDEQLTGADKKFYNSGFAFFMQFKVSEGLEPISKVPSSFRINRSYLEDVREFRDQHGLNDKPTLYFELRKQAKKAIDFQHNILMKHANQTNSQAFYVAPLHLDKDKYYRCLFGSVVGFRGFPFLHKTYGLHSPDWVSYVGDIPFLKEHISIIPHEKISTHKHCYSYSVTGCDVGWHSPEVLSEAPSRLSDLMKREIEVCLSQKKLISLSELSKKLINSDESNISPDRDDRDEYEPLEQLQKWGRSMCNQYGIKMFLFLGNKEQIS